MEHTPPPTHLLWVIFVSGASSQALCLFAVETVVWFLCPRQDWIEFEEIADLEERAKSQFFEKENEVEVQKNQAAAKEKEIQCVKATKDQVSEVRQTRVLLWQRSLSNTAVQVTGRGLQPCYLYWSSSSNQSELRPHPLRGQMFTERLL